MAKDLPTTARAVVIGGGIVGCSTAYHLAKLGWTDTVLLERKKLTSGTTFHAAGLVGQLRSNANITELLGYSVDLYNRLEEETGLATGWKMNGGLRLACNDARWEEVKRQATTAQSFGLDMQLLTPAEARELWPIMTVEDVVGAAFLPTDGQANPSDITQALAKGARMAGATIFEDTAVTDIRIERGKIKGVQTDKGFIECEVVICCAGQWTREFAGRFGVNVPLVPVQHQYLITEPIKDMPRNLPTLRDPDRLTYYKEEVGGLVMGGYEPNPVLWAEAGIPEDFHFTLLQSDFDHFEPMMELALGRVPALETTGIKELVNGPESFTPDGNFILGEAPELKNFFVGAGFNAFGIASGGGAGMVLAEWVAKGEPPYDLWAVDIRRFGKPHFDADWIKKRTVEAYGKHYTMAWPHEEHQSGRPFRTSPLYDKLKAAGACFGEKLGWERPNWFADVEAGETPEDTYSFSRQNWFKAVAREHKATREAAVLIDQTSFAKFHLTGPHAAAALDWIAAGNVLRPPGSVIYTQMLNDRGGIECDLTVTRLDQNEFYIVTGTGFATHDYNWILRNIPPNMTIALSDITEKRSVLSLMGPLSREILSQVTNDDISHEGFPFATGRMIEIAGHPVMALRLTYMGELGWELHMPVGHAAAVYDALMTAGAPSGLSNAGYRTIESCRLEKGYRAWGADIGPDHTPIEAGLGWAVKLKSGRDFKGRAAIETQKAAGVKKMLACFTVDDPDVVLLGRETIYRNGKRVGWLSSGGYGHTIAKSIGYGYVRNPEGVDAEFVLDGRYELDVALTRVPCQVHLEPLYDPGMKKIKS
ncbi:GcvT family protein [Sneathiella sp. CAU 1612]|uniref:GcvT family protein n=1 Tax=Sneathiella sedimenti TaxID=2816034 RepID=A0ABS3F9D8_9PROT|nr:FAD-dependent oxidoreductase [Sneathiella sedimenti]MBO0335149.1 GcvT family protein [Sneathiella sedimenti]